MKKFIVLILMLISFMSYSTEKNKNVQYFNVSGKITDISSKETLVGVEVIIKNTNIKSYSDLDGNFYINDLPKGDYELQINYISYNGKKEYLKIDNNKNIKIELNELLLH